mgnify:FL=1
MLAHSKLLHLIKSGAVPHRAQLSRWRAMAEEIIAKSDSYNSLSDQELRKRGLELTWKARTAPELDDLLLESYALVREAARRSLGMSHYAVQLMGGIALFEGGIAEMQTGEGKTLTAVLPAFLRALPGRGCHVITVNDYLAGRDAELMRPVYEMLGMTVGCVQSDSTPEDRRNAYSCSITYGTSKEIGFDFLRDRLQLGEAALEREQHPHLLYRPHRNPAVVQRGHYFAMIDEADSVLIDEARTPLIIGLKQQPRAANVILHRWSWRTTSKLEPNLDFVYEPKRRSAYLTEAGCRRLLLLPKPSVLDTIDTERLHKHVEKALTARFGCQRDLY